MNTEKTKPNEEAEAVGWVFYDASCVFCSDWAARFDRTLSRRGFRIEPLQSPSARERLGLREGAPLDEMRVLGGGRNLGGADAVVFLARRIWWAWPLWLLAFAPGMRGLLRAAYRWIAARRDCLGGKCEQRKPVLWPGWIGLATLPPAALLARDAVPAWAFMWAFAGAIFLGCKWLTFWREKQRPGRIAPVLAFGYLFAWPGMDAAGFLRPPGSLPTAGTDPNRLLPAIAKTALGAWLLWGVARTATDPLIQGWIGMSGLIFMLHFGLFHLLALAWQACGVDARPIMEAPVRSTSLAEFWGRRWNGAFNRLAHDFVFRPVAKKLGAATATLAAFGVSGLIHELVISLPARGGWGLPTAYFFLQGLALLAERSRGGRRAGLGRGVPGWLFTMLLVAGPAFWLFHPPFVRRVIVPFLQTIHAL